MPEAPEVTFLTETIEAFARGRRIIGVSNAYGKQFKNANQFKPPQTVQGVEKKGKVIFIHLSNEHTLVSRLGLTGWWHLVSDAELADLSPKIIFTFEKTETRLVYTDLRHFGTLEYKQTAEAMAEDWEPLAMDIIDHATSTEDRAWDRWSFLLAKKRGSIREKLIEDILMDQKMWVSGIGNYLKSEGLYLARLAPTREGGSLTEREVRRLFQSLQEVVRRSYEALRKAPSIHVWEEDESTLAVYRKTRDSKGNPVETRTDKTGRTTYWVPEVQV